LTDISSGGTGLGRYSTSTLACRNGTTAGGTNKYLPPGDTAPVITHYVYNDSSLSSLYDGGNSWHLMTRSGTTWAVL